MAEENVLVPMTKTGNVTQLKEFEGGGQRLQRRGRRAEGRELKRDTELTSPSIPVSAK